MSSRHLIIPFVAVLTLTACSPEASETRPPLAPASTTSPASSPSPGSDSTLEPLTERGLAAAVIAHLAPTKGVTAQSGGDPAGVSVFVVTRAPESLISVTVSSATPDVALGRVQRMPALSDDNANGSTLMGSSTRADGTVVTLFAEFYGQPLLTVAEGQALVDDPLISIVTTPEVNAAGADLANYTEAAPH